MIESREIDQSEQLILEIQEKIFDWELSDILELTYAYTDLWNWLFLNRTLFEDFIWENHNNNLKNLYDKTSSKLKEKRKLVKNYIWILNWKWHKSDKINILIWTLKYVYDVLSFVLKWLHFEWEKAWLKLSFDRSKIEKIVLEMESMEIKLFWWNIRDNESEKKEIYTLLYELLQQNRDKLNINEQWRFIWYISNIKPIDVFEANIVWEKSESDKANDDMLDKLISREDYIKIFQLVFEIYGINKPIIVDERSSIYDWENALYIPDSKAKAYDNLKLKRVLQLIQHEIETHYIIEKNNNNVLWKFRWAKNLEREEWLATVSEWLFSWKKLDDFNFEWSSLVDLIMWEILDGNDFKDFIWLYYKLRWLKNVQWMFLRRKRNYPIRHRWVQHKDVSYTRWTHKVINFLKNWWDVKDLYVWKVSFEDLGLVKKMAKSMNFDMEYPLLIWEIILFSLKNKKINYEIFLKYIKEKYPFIDPNDLNKKLTISTKRKIIEILNTVNK